VTIYDTSLTANTICLPTSTTVKNEISAALGSSGAGFASLLKNYSLIIIAIPIAIVIAVIFMLLIRLVAGIFIYLLIFACIAALVAVGTYLIISPTTSSGSAQGGLSTTNIIIAVVCYLLAFLIILILCCFRSRISLASSIVKVAAKFVA
jgi:hypothetical protein